MNLDVNTLFMVTIYVEAILGLLLLFAWAQNTQIRAVCWWGFAHLIRATSVVLFGMYGTAPDLIGRIGGEEFAAVLYDTSRDKAVAVAERMRESFAQIAQDVDGRPVCSTVSIGLVHCEAAVLDIPELLAQADQALYFAKENGRNRVEVASLEMILERKNSDKNGETATSVVAIAAKSAA